MEPAEQGPQALLGKVIAGYRLDRILGTGATGAVFMGAYENNASDRVAVKLLIPATHLSASERADFYARFRREAQTLLGLSHPHILSITGFGEDLSTGYSYMVLPYYGGGTLADRLKTGPLALSLIADYLSQLASAIDYAHQHGVIHRDIKPSNILFDDYDQIALADFSIASLFAGGGATLTGTGQVLGTPLYMAPEQMNRSQVGPATDIYSLGVVLYQMVTGVVPFDGDMPLEVVLKHVQEPPPSPRALRVDLPAPAEAAMMRALAKQPAGRFASAQSLAVAFATGLAGQWVDGMESQQLAARDKDKSYDTMPSVLPPTLADSSPAFVGQMVTPPYVQLGDSYSTRGKRHTRPNAGWAIALALFLLAAVLASVAFVSQGRLLSLTPWLNSGVVSTATTQAQAGASPTTSTQQVFQRDQLYNYNTLIGRSKPSALTNSTVNVVLVSLRFSTASQTTTITISFQNYDTKKGADFLFQKLDHVYLIDNANHRYAATQATPNEVLIDPDKDGAIVVTFPLADANVSALSLYFNTDLGALDIPCALLTPMGNVASCPSV